LEVTVSITHRTDVEIAEAVDHAKHPVSAAAGPYGHPFHPILVTIPIGAWVCSLIFDIVSRVNSAGSPPLVDASYWLIGIGVIGALLAAVFGLMDLSRIPRQTKARRFGLTHMTINLVVVAAYVVNFLWRHGSYDQAAKVQVGQLVLSTVAIGLLLISGTIGGMLAYRFGVRVADEATQGEGYA
jgi:uncharacterized membrane protein